MINQTITNLSTKEFQIYQVLCDLNLANITQLSQETGIKRTTIYNFIDKLINSNLISKKIINGKFYFIANKREENNRRIVNLSTAAKAPIAINNFELIIGKRNIKNAIDKTLEYDQTDWIADSKTTTELLGNRFLEKYIEAGAKKQAKIRVLRSYISKGKHKYHSQEAIMKAGRLIRRSQSTIPYNGTIIIFGQKILLISSENSGLAYLIDDPIINQTFRSIFTGLWKYSKILGD